MATIIDQEAMLTATEMPQCKFSQDDDTASTVSGASSDQVSPPCSPGTSEMASLPSSPANVFPDAALVTTESLADLPSLGSLGHFAGLCSRCCFHAKGRCQNGHDCRFCHFEHEKRQRKKKIKPFDGYNASGPVAPRVVAPPSPMTPLSPPPGLEMVPFETPSMPAVLGLRSNIPTATLPQQSQQPGVESWPVEGVVRWLSDSGLGPLAKSFEEHRITGDVLLTLNAAELEEIGVHAFGDKKRLLKGISQLQLHAQEHLAQPAQAAQQQLVYPPPPPSWEAPSSFEAHSFCAYPPPTPPPVMECDQCSPPEPPSFDAPM